MVQIHLPAIGQASLAALLLPFWHLLYELMFSWIRDSPFVTFCKEVEYAMIDTLR